MDFDYLPSPGTPLEELDTPCLIVDLDTAEQNILKMELEANSMGVSMRPHAKTHKSSYWAKKQIEAGAIGICCAKVGEAEVMARAGIRGILIPNQIIGEEKIQRLISVAKMTSLIVACDSEPNLTELSMAATADRIQIGVIVEVNIGMDRCGVDVDEALRLAKIIDTLPGIKFMGVMGYEGHIVAERDYETRSNEARKAIGILRSAVKKIESTGMSCEIVSAAGTGTYRFTGLEDSVTELQCGSYIFMDGDYMEVMDDFEPAMYLMTTVISNHINNQVVVDAGLKSISIDRGLADVIEPTDAKLLRHSEEHSKITIKRGKLNIGDKVKLRPKHGDTTINLHDYYFGIRNNKLETVIPINARGKFR
jgi:3-hydroxy-D-aspartate aldolase